MAESQTFATAVRIVESGSSVGKYNQVKGRVRKGRLVGAYGFPSDEWKLMASEAGLEGARWGDPKAQDIVADRIFRALHAKYGDWRLVAVAWKAGEEIADMVAASPQLLDDSRLVGVKDYVRQVMSAARDEIAVNSPADDDNNPITEDRFQPTLRGLSQGQPALDPTPAEDVLRGVLTAIRDRRREMASPATGDETDIRMSEPEGGPPEEPKGLVDRVLRR